jgi:hypothetical protein
VWNQIRKLIKKLWGLFGSVFSFRIRGKYFVRDCGPSSEGRTAEIPLRCTIGNLRAI